MLVPASRAIARSDAPSTPSQKALARCVEDARRDVAAGPCHQPSFFLKRSAASVTSTARMPASQTSSAATSPKPAPLSVMPRTMRRKCVSGSACASHCAGARHGLEREHEAGQQDVRQQEEERHLHRLLLRVGERREEQAERQVGGDEHERERVEQPQRADERHAEDQAADEQDQRHLHVADRHVRHDLADDELDAARPARRSAARACRARARARSPSR